MWNMVFMQLYLEELGNEVNNLGVCTPTELLLRDAEASSPDMIVISSINGHAADEAVTLAEAVRKSPLLKEVTLVIGGKLGIMSQDGDLVEQLHAAGFDGVFIEGQSCNPLQEFNNQYFPALVSGKSLVA
jgi:methylaspartate mutase sigma subunit